MQTQQGRRQAMREQRERLIRALVYFQEHRPELLTRPVIRAIASRFMVHPKSFEQAIALLIEQEQSQC